MEMASVDSKSFLGLLNGLARRTYHGDTDLTDELLHSELFPDSSKDDFESTVHKAMGMMKSMVSADMDFNQLEAFLTSHTKKKEGGITEEQAKIYMKFWKTHKAKIHDSVIAQNTWNSTLKSVNWRIDIKSQAKHIDQINTPTAIMELQIANHNDKKDAEVLRFEMDETKLTGLMKSMQEIEEQIAKHCQQ